MAPLLTPLGAVKALRVSWSLTLDVNLFVFYVIITIPLSWGYELLCIVNNKYTVILKEKIEDFIIQACVHMFENCKKKNSDNHFF